METVDNPLSPTGLEPLLSAIAVVAADGAIGRGGELLCHLPADLRHFKTLTMGHSLIMGRRTFESLPGGALPGRQNIVVTRRLDYAPDGVTVVHSVAEAIAAATLPGEIFVIGGEQIYRATLPLVATLHLTMLNARFPDADAFFPAIDPDEWQCTWAEEHEADERNPYGYTFATLCRQ